VASAKETLPPLLTVFEKNGAKVGRLATRPATLEDVFMTLTGAALHD
jgi:hypothetical protein